MALLLRKATREQQAQSIQRHAHYWGKPLTTEEYVERERVLIERPFARDGSMEYWVLVPRDDPTTLDFLASCETFRRTILYNTGNTGLQRLPSYSIASVFIPEQYRSKGYGRQLMSRLHDALKLERPHPAASFLFSDIGDYYSSCASETGEVWAKQSTRELFVPLSAISSDSLEGIDPLDEVGVQPVVIQDGQLIESEVKSAKEGTMAVELSGLEVDWQIARTEFYSAAPSEPLPPVGAPAPAYGARLRIDGELAYAVWSYDLPKKRVQILRLRVTTGGQLAALLAAAKRAGEEQGCTDLLIWNPPTDLLGEEVRGYVRDMQDSWPCLAWYGADQAPRWLFEEKYVWC